MTKGKLNSVEFWPHPIWDRKHGRGQQAIEMFTSAFDRVREAHPTTRLHVLVEVGDRYRDLRSRLAKRAALTRKANEVKAKRKKDGSYDLSTYSLRRAAQKEQKQLPTPTREPKSRKSAKPLKKKVFGT